MKPFIICVQLFTLCVQLSACGGDGSETVADETVTQSKPLPKPLPNTQATFDAVALASPMKSCPHNPYFLAGENFTWRLLANPSDTSPSDMLEVRENCTFHSFSCGSLGYIISGGTTWGNGLVKIMLLGYLYPKTGCDTPGEYDCAYSQQDTGVLKLACNLVREQEWVP